jgi:hypothetical protein
MGKARQVQLAIFNREWERTCVVHFLAQGDIAGAQAHLAAVTAHNAEHSAHMKSAMELHRASLGVFIAGSACTLVAVLLYSP